MKTLLVLLALFNVSLGDDPPIIFRREDSIYDWIYDDRDSGSDRDMSIWRPVTAQNGFFALGDVAVTGHSKPQTASTMVKDMTGDSLSQPSGFTEVWTDSGSGGTYDVRIMKMNPPSGYTCLGHVAIRGYGNTPDKSLYRCVKSEYVVKGKYELIWTDSGSGADRDVSLWSNRVSSSNTYGIDANTFTSFSKYQADGEPDLLDGEVVKNSMDVGVDTVPHDLTVYEIDDLEVIWKDTGSGVSHDVSIWRSGGTPDAYSLGDIAVKGHTNPGIGFIVRANVDNVLRVPYDFEKIWIDSGSSADWDVGIYKPICDPGFRPIGHVSVRSHSTLPEKSDIHCVNTTYTTAGDWEFIWNDSGSGASKDVSMWRAVARSGGQGVGAMSAQSNHGDMEEDAYVLVASQTNYIYGSPAEKYILQNVQYLLDDSQILDQQPKELARTPVENHGTSEQTTSRSQSYTYEETYSWTHNVGGEIGVEVTVSAGIPFFAQGEVSTSASGSYSYEWGGSSTESFTDSITASVTVQGCSSKDMIITGNNYKMDVPYTATLITIHEDGSQSTNEKFEGVFKGMEVSEIRVIYEPDIPIPGCGEE